MRQLFSEIWTTLKRNKLRTFLTGFAIAWGIFILIVLLAAGNGLKNGVTSNFGDRTVNKVTLWGGQTSLPYKGYAKNRFIKFQPSDSVLLATALPHIETIIPVFKMHSREMKYLKESSSPTIEGAIPELQDFDKIKIDQGRFINQIDNQEKRKVIVISSNDASVLFQGEDPIGKEIIIDHIVYQVVGVHSNVSRWENLAYAPYSTLTALYNPSEEVQEFMLTVKDLETIEKNEQFNKEVLQLLSHKHNFDPNDHYAIHVWNMLENYVQTMRIFRAITIFIWIVGLGTLVAGVVGVGNIMLITVRERTKEFGIQKAIGAKPALILRQIIMETVVITTLFGYVGMFMGILVTELVNKVMVMNQMGRSGEFSIFSNPTVDLKIAISATLVMILAGVVASYFPAKNAVKIKPIEALRYE